MRRFHFRNLPDGFFVLFCFVLGFVVVLFWFVLLLLFLFLFVFFFLGGGGGGGGRIEIKYPNGCCVSSESTVC